MIICRCPIRCIPRVNSPKLKTEAGKMVFHVYFNQRRKGWSHLYVSIQVGTFAATLNHVQVKEDPRSRGTLPQ